ncbi:MAG: ATP synthase F0 subunit B [Acidimicrobiaceae bacterium]|jgi:F-type H+-transporting ATPase subunit b|nr:ATP synthase F0 subunit B [Actinomycetota bacterium]MDA2955533.1 ATP synthase F0 subunit B [Actinomycetota bacterium]NQW33878.1 ATP synthase F0 subunit B [Acidimicrobiaceae bacterium]
MLRAFVSINSTAQVRVTFDVVSAETGSEEGAPVSAGPNPIAPEIKELAWGAGSFIVFLFFMRLFLVPKVRKGMASRYESIQADHEYASATRDGAKQDVARYESAIAEIRSEAARRLETARQTLDKERSEKVAQVNAQIAQRRSAAEAEVAAARAAAQSQIVTAVGAVTTRATQIAVGVSPDAAIVSRSVQQAMEGTRS